MPSGKIEKVAVVGAGYMGGGIAQVLAMAGVDVTIADANAQSTERAHRRLLDEGRDFEQRGLFPAGAAEKLGKHLHMAGDVESAVQGVGLVEEAVPETPQAKADVLQRIEGACDPETIIASNTSTLPIGELAKNLNHSSRFLGVHFSNPAPFIPGVELISHSGTDESCVGQVEELVARTGKLTARVNDKAGFVLNRLQYVLLKEAINLVEEGVATAEDIDVVVRTTFGYRLPFFGPFAIADMAGLDVYRDCFTTLEQHYGERLAPPQMLTSLVDQGHYGVKRDGGFVIDAKDPSELIAYRNTAYARLGQLLAELGPAPL